MQAVDEAVETAELELPRVDNLPAEPLFEAENIIYIDPSEPDMVYINSKPGVAWRAKISEIGWSVWQLLAQGVVIAADVKELYHALDAHGVTVRFHEVWDVGQAAFLIDPLRRDRSLAAHVATAGTTRPNILPAAGLYGDTSAGCSGAP